MTFILQSFPPLCFNLATFPGVVFYFNGRMHIATLQWRVPWMYEAIKSRIAAVLSVLHKRRQWYFQQRADNLRTCLGKNKLQFLLDIFQVLLAKSSCMVLNVKCFILWTVCNNLSKPDFTEQKHASINCYIKLCRKTWFPLKNQDWLSKEGPHLLCIILQLVLKRSQCSQVFGFFSAISKEK